MFKKVVSGVLCVAFLAALFSVTAFSSSSDLTNPIVNTPDPIISFQNITTWITQTQSSDLSYTSYNGSGGRLYSRIIGWNNNNNNSVYYINRMNNIIAGKTYIITGQYSFGVYNSGYFELGTTTNYNSSINETEYNYRSFTNDTTNNIVDFTYAFNSNVTNDFNTIYYYSLDLVLKFTKTSSSRDAYIYVDNLNILCLDDILIKLGVSSVDNLEVIKQYIWDMLYDNTQSNNISDMVFNQFEFFRWFMTNYPNSIHSEYYKKYGNDFWIALYEAIAGEPGVEYETDPAVSDAISDYAAAESELMQDKSADVSSAFNSGMQGIQNNNAFQWIRDTLQSTIFDNTKITGYILFALSMGLIVLVLGRKIHV